MKVILLMTVSANGYIARQDDDAPWSAEEFARCGKYAQDIGNLIVGRRTYEIMKEAGDFDDSIQTVVLTSHPKEAEESVSFTRSPKEALELLENKGFATALVSGGSTANASFLNEGLVDELVLDIEPILFDQGLPVFKNVHKDVRLKLLEVSKLDDNAVRLHYSTPQ